jgi:PAS domain S-box-containing protein
MKAILIVEDEQPLANVIAGYVATLDYQVAGKVDSGEEALKIAAKGPISLALLDINICGKMNGFAVAEALRRQYDIPSIFLTGQSDEQTMQSVLESSAYGYLLKPFRPEELKAAIELAFIRYAQETRWKQVEQSFSAAIHSTSDGVIITDAQSHIQFMNPAAERMTGWIARLVKGEKLTSVMLVKEGEAVLAQLWKSAYDGDSTRAELEIGRKSELARLDVSLARVEDAARGPQGVVLVLRDNTQHFRDQEELRRSRSQVRNLTERLFGAKDQADAERSPKS